jgi:enterochelin esterase-like enzyme
MLELSNVTARPEHYGRAQKQSLADILVPNRNLRDVLFATGYEVHYQEFDGGHDGLSWRSTLADGLVLLMGRASTQSLQQPAAKPQP